ncbi:hypothetical protein KC207_09840 [Phycicoccus sp. BSK3Z-2]|uniref:Uncharacterized protein n=1 Tax=Phycicoccus avicenniae TaxID=2828860 RepID=A0A941D895_9MICO|nr:DUF6350 family protein [Phycicoccus avicenniae]MBR7743590.1 hypothetical protein [Phycicoccus avicenniae]
MTVVDRLRSALPGDDASRPSAWDPGWRRAGILGVGTGLVSALLVVVPVWLAWDADPTGRVADAIRVGAGLWLLVGGAHLGVDGASVTLTPLLAFGILLVLARYGVREGIVAVRTDGPHWAGLLPRPLAAALAAWWAGYVVVVGAGWLLAADGPFPPQPWSLVLPALVLPGLGVGLAVRAVVRDDPDLLGPRVPVVLPDLARRALGPGLAGAGVLLALGTLVLLGAVALAWPRVSALDADLAAGSTGGAVLAAAQLVALPNLALWVVSFLAGTGFSVVDGSSVSWSGAEGGLMPLLPVLGAVPQPGAFSPAVPVVSVLALLAVGVLVGRRSVRTVARLSRLRTKLAVALWACLVTAGSVGALDLLGGGALGQFRLADVGAPAVRMSVALLVPLVVGAVSAVLRDAWRLRR